MVARALLSVTDKTGIIDFARGLKRFGAEVISTGGTARVLREAGVEVTPLEDYTNWPEMLEGRVKTLHPRVHAGLLARRDRALHREEMAQHQIPYIDLVAVNLYDFAGAAAGRERLDPEVLEAIDIGGPTLLRAAAKNFEAVLPVVRPSDYPRVLAALEAGGPSPELRRELAATVFEQTSRYDAAIAAFLAEVGPSKGGAPALLLRSLQKVVDLRYGENAHQAAALYRDVGEPRGLAHAEVLQGKALSYNNLLDIDAALGLSVDLDSARSEANVVFVKHNNPCGVAVHADPAEAVHAARACDPVSAFGAVIAVSRPIQRPTAEALTETFVEAVIAPDVDAEAQEVFAKKKNLRLLRLKEAWRPSAAGRVWREIRGGVLCQDADVRADPEAEVSAAQVVTRKAPSEEERVALALAWIVAKHVKSNAIVFARPDRVVAVGAGQMSRVDAVKICELKGGDRLRGAAVASDAFFPFRDGVDVVARAGASAIVQPGGSIRDEEVVKAADEHGLAMVFTGVRHFRH